MAGPPVEDNELIQIFTAVLIAISIVFVPKTVFALPEEAHQLAKDFEKTKQNLEKSETKQRQVLSALYQLNKKIKKMVTEKGSYTQKRVMLEMNIRSLTQQVQELDAKSKAQKTLLAERLKVIYKMGGQSFARMVFDSSNAAVMERNLKIMGLVASRDLDMIKSYSEDLKELQHKKNLLALRLQSLQSVENKIVQQEKSLLTEQNTKNKILEGLRKSKLFAINKINGLREKSMQFNVEDSGLLDLLFKPSFADQKGELPVPLEGSVVKRFGLVKTGERSYTLNHKGVFIGAIPGSPIKSVFDGTVSYVGTLPGFGQTLIVDHGDHYYTVYAHTEKVQVNVGQAITQAQVIASAGNPTSEDPSGLYFEIRHFSEPYDPQLWMKGR